MANELYFIFSEIAEQDKAIEFLTSRPNYKAEAKQLSYDNPDTDASFTVEFGGRLVGEDDIPEIDGPFLNFRINYLRPEIYLDEVSTELEIFTKEFKTRFYDEIVGEIRPFQLSQFQESWKQTNSGGINDESQDWGFHFADTQTIKQNWRWNYERQNNNAKLGQEIFIAKTSWFLKTGSPELYLFSAWPDAIPIIFSANITHLLLGKSQSSAMGFLSRLLRAEPKPDIYWRLISKEDLLKLDIFDSFQLNGLDCYKLNQSKDAQAQKLFSEINAETNKQFEKIQIQNGASVIENTIKSNP